MYSSNNLITTLSSVIIKRGDCLQSLNKTVAPISEDSREFFLWHPKFPYHNSNTSLYDKIYSERNKCINKNQTMVSLETLNCLFIADSVQNSETSDWRLTELTRDRDLYSFYMFVVHVWLSLVMCTWLYLFIFYRISNSS